MGPGDQPPSTGRHNAEIAEGPASIDAEPLSAANSHATDPAPAEKAPLSPAASKRAKKLMSLKSQIASQQAQLTALQVQLEAIKPQLRNPDPFVTVKQHIKLLHDYNEIRDVGMGLMGIIADNRNMRVRDVYAEFGVGEDD